ncbi:MAG: tRNA (guanine-N(7)-)-methyltransferase [Amphiamblys sp. WSBS2006]|nr:MAG: tRNA (guanine-N(7)-)-methyltransferase [Amphiamblys sp. WSBS2006]OIR59046.1 MAG: tRNA (guanine-N(7)-)-methyltransferase [Amphiamblys sp. WSBS2006]
MNAEQPRKKDFRQRAHSNPFSEHNLETPLNPERMCWTQHYPGMNEGDGVSFLDVGCGYGGLLFELGRLFPEKLSLGMEIRVKVTDYVRRKIEAQRGDTGKYKNIAVLRTNAMKHILNFFSKGQLEKMFFLFPDPHFKKKKHKARIISDILLTQYSYLMCPGGRLYISTDVRALYGWMEERLDRHRDFRRLSGDEERADALWNTIVETTEEGIKVERNEGDKYRAIYERV